MNTAMKVRTTTVTTTTLTVAARQLRERIGKFYTEMCERVEGTENDNNEYRAKLYAIIHARETCKALMHWPLVDIQMHWFEEGKFWEIKVCRYFLPDEEDAEPEPWMDHYHETDDEADAWSFMETLAEMIMDLKQADRVVTFCEGNEHKVYNAND